MQGTVGRSLIFRARPPCSRVSLLGDNMRFSETSGSARSRDASGRRFPNPSASGGRRFCSAVEIGFYAQCWSCFSELDVGWSEPLLFIFNRQLETNYAIHKL